MRSNDLIRGFTDSSHKINNYEHNKPHFISNSQVLVVASVLTGAYGSSWP